MYSEAHRLLLTYIRSVRYVEAGVLLEAFKFMLGNLQLEVQPLKNVLDQYIAEINSKISGQNFKIERKTHEITGDLYYIFINTLSDEIVQESSVYTTAELTVIKYLIRNIIEASDYRCSLARVNANQTISTNTNKNLMEADSMVDRLIDDGWFISTIDDRLMLSIKTLCELKEYLIETYGVNGDDTDADGKVLLCTQCKEIVTLGWIVPSGNKPFHRKCYDVYCRTNQIYPEDESDLLRVGPDPSTL